MLPSAAAALSLATLLAVPALPSAAEAAALPPGTVSGTVTDDDGQPMAGVCVTAYQSGLRQYPLGRACTGSAGTYTLAGLPTDVQVKVLADAPGYPEYHYPGVPTFFTATGLSLQEGRTADIRLSHRTGTVRGRMTWPDGSPVTQGRVFLLPVGAGATPYLTHTFTDGRYELGQLPPGQYQVALRPVLTDLALQYVPGSASREQATVLTVAAGGQYTVDETVLPSVTRPAPPALGTITGVVRDRATGAPLPGACVALHDSSYGTMGIPRATSCADASGTYTLAEVPVGPWYRVAATAAGHLPAWAPAAPEYTGAAQFDLTAGQVQTADLRLSSTGGRLQGTLRQYTGAPAMHAYVEVTDTSTGWLTYTRTGRNGRYEFDGLPPGSYRVMFMPATDPQYWPHQADQAQAQPVTVADRATVTADDTMLPATVRVTVVHEPTNAPVTGTCVTIGTQRDCDGPAGVYELLTDDGDLPLTVDGSAAYHQASQQVRARSGETTEVRVTLQPTTAIRLSLRSAVDPGRVPLVCARAVPVRHGTDAIQPPKDYCNLPTGPSEPKPELVIGLGSAEPVNIFMWSIAGVHGAQWVGAHGGTGRRATAAVITPVLGATTTGPDVVLDRELGLQVDAYRAEPFDRLRTCASPVGLTGGLEGLDRGGCSTSGPFWVGSLGPYTWDVQVHSPGYATTWLTGGNDRTTASGLTPPATGNWYAQVYLARGAKLSGTVQAAAGRTPYDVTVFSAVTGDIVAQQKTTSAYAFDTLNSGPLLVRVRDTEGRSCWHRETTGVGPGRRQIEGYLIVTADKPRTGLTLALGPDCRTTPPPLVTRTPAAGTAS